MTSLSSHYTGGGGRAAFGTPFLFQLRGGRKRGWHITRYGGQHLAVCHRHQEILDWLCVRLRRFCSSTLNSCSCLHKKGPCGTFSFVHLRKWAQAHESLCHNRFASLAARILFGICSHRCCYPSVGFATYDCFAGLMLQLRMEEGHSLCVVGLPCKLAHAKTKGERRDFGLSPV